MSAIEGPLEAILAAGARLFGLGLDMAAGRLELLGLEARELKIRLIQGLVLAGLGVALLVVGLALALVAILLAVPAPWRPLVAAGGAAGCLGAAGLALFGLRRRLARLSLAFSQTVAELKKDRECF